MTKWRGLALACAVMGVACADGAAEPVTLENAASRLAASSCEAMEACGLNAVVGNPAGLYDLCVERVKTTTNDLLSYYEADIESGALSFAPDVVEACEQRHAECADFIPDCVGFVRGERAVGSSCLLDAECGDGAYCAYDNECRGTCKRAGQEGDECSGAARCDVALYCDRSKGCQPAAKEGESCAGDKRCLPELQCVTYQDSADEPEVARCEDRAKWLRPVRKKGESCGESQGLCEPEWVCVFDDDATEGVGFCKEPFERDGACLKAVPSGCPADQYCDSTRGACVSRLDPGETCEASTDCKVGSVCAGFECRVLAAKGVGEGCDNDGQCASGQCAGGECQLISGCIRFSINP